MWCRTSGTERIYWQQSKTTKNQCSVTLNDSTNVEALMQIILREGPSEKEKRVYLISTDIWTKVSEGDRLNCTDSSKTRKEIPIDLSFKDQTKSTPNQCSTVLKEVTNRDALMQKTSRERPSEKENEGLQNVKADLRPNQSHYRWTQNKSPWSWQSKRALINSRTIKKEISKIKQKLPKQSLQFHKKNEPSNHEIPKQKTSSEIPPKGDPQTKISILLPVKVLLQKARKFMQTVYREAF